MLELFAYVVELPLDNQNQNPSEIQQVLLV